ncbi:long-chain-fatty-acid--CoA ligase [compost metagenome]
MVVRAGQQLDEPSLIAWARERMANYKVPRQVRFFESLPVNASNKVVKGELREAVLQAGGLAGHAMRS